MAFYSEFWKRYNTSTQVYPDGSSKTLYCNLSIFKYPTSKPKSLFTLRPGKKKAKSLSTTPRKDNLYRAKSKLFDLAFCNDWSHFLTITYNPSKVDSYNASEVLRKTNKWLQNQVTRRGLRYILVPEYHESGRIHCHALINDVFTFVDSGHKDEHGHVIYNIPEWRNGWSTAIHTYGNKLRTACYLTKYITKDTMPIFGRMYWSSRNIVREPELVLSNTDYYGLDIALDFTEYEIEKAGLLFKYENMVRLEEK